MESGVASVPASETVSSTGKKQKRCRCGRKILRGRGGRGLCPKCWQSHRSRMIAYGKWEPMYVPIGPTVEHLRKLSAAGMGTVRVADLAGLCRHTVQQLNRSGRKTCARKVADGILAVPIPEHSPFNELFAPGAMIPIIGTMRRLRALAVAGYDLADLGARLGMKFQHVSYLRLGKSPKVTVRVARNVAKMFNELQMTPGPSGAATRVAERNGWHPPLAWDEESIDDPTAKPGGIHDRRNRRLDSSEFAARIADHRSVDHTDDEIADRMGIAVASLQDKLKRNGLPTGRRYRDVEDTHAVLSGNSMSKKALGIR